jgi:hypothetical protein
MALALFSLLSGCTLYFGDDDCASSGGALPAPDLRNPVTGQCEYGPSGGPGHPGSCDGHNNQVDDDIAYPATRAADAVALDWAQCRSACDGLPEATCLRADGCRAAYRDDCPNCDSLQLTYVACWATAPSGPLRGEGCFGLDAYKCSRHDDCSAVHGPFQTSDAPGGFMSALGAFEYCMPERDSAPGCYSDAECPAGSECTSDTECLPPPGCGPASPCPPVCYGRCVPKAPACDGLGEGACVARADCTPLYAGHDCACTPAGCSCGSWTFEQCVAGDGSSAGFTCGNQVCGAGEYCQVTTPGIPGGQTGYGCRALPAACAAAGPAQACECLEKSVCAMKCGTDALGHTTATCFAP